MSSREKILAALRANKPDPLDLPAFSWEKNSSLNVTEIFIKNLQRIGGEVSIIKDIATIKKNLREIDQQQKRIVNCLESLNWNHADNLTHETAADLEKIEVAIIEGSIGVAENGAVWVDESIIHRALPFICQHLILVLPIQKIVSTMHEAYASIDITKYGFGTFIAGPSKTADIEQALVIGAHGPRSLKVYLLE